MDNASVWRLFMYYFKWLCGICIWKGFGDGKNVLYIMSNANTLPTILIPGSFELSSATPFDCSRGYSTENSIGDVRFSLYPIDRFQCCYTCIAALHCSLSQWMNKLQLSLIGTSLLLSFVRRNILTQNAYSLFRLMGDSRSLIAHFNFKFSELC